MGWRERVALAVAVVVVAGTGAGGCTRDNPAFAGLDPGSDGASGTATGSTVGPTTVEPDSADATTGNASATGTGTSEASTSEASTETAATTEGPPVCEGLVPKEGADIVFGLPSDGRCPPTVDVQGYVVGGNADEVTFHECPGCGDCRGELPLAVSGLDLSVALPHEICFHVEAHEPLSKGNGQCHYGAVTVLDDEFGVPYLIATTQSIPPTPSASVVLALPDPEPTVECACEEVGLERDMCCQEDGPVTFWTYEIDKVLVYPGSDAVPFEGLGDMGPGHGFQLFQAQTLHTCEAPERQISWAIVADG